MSLKDLAELHHKIQCETSPAARTGYFKKKYSDKTEKGLMECIEDHCEMTNSGMFWRTPNKSSQVGSKPKMKSGASINEVLSGIATEKVSPVFGYSSGTNGMSDMAGFFTVNISRWSVPIAVALEIKIPGDTHKPDQKKFEARINKAGGWYVIVEDFNSYIAMKNLIINKYAL